MIMPKETDPHYLSIFTPSQTDPKDLEAIFVQREALLADAIERIIESVKTKNKQHQLIVGNRGAGKTHLVSLLVYRLNQNKQIKKKLKIAWLNEDETCTSFLDLLLNTYDSLNKRYPDEFSLSEMKAVYDKSPDEAQIFLGELLADKLKKPKKTCLVIIENLDALFESIGSIGQKQLRAYLQENPLFSLFTTAQKLTGNLKNRSDPFFGFFQTEHLKPLTEEQAAELISKIAKLQNKKEVSSFLKTNKGKMRIKALHHLSGGNHRVYLVLSQFISRDSIDALVPPFLKMVDEMTPYYQERLRWLPPVQRKIIETLSATRTTQSVKQIAKRLFSSNQTISSQLKELKDKGYVKSYKRGRESLYEMTEPLMRICVEVKDNHGNKPIAILVEFIRAWYDGYELQSRLDKTELSQLSKQYLFAAYEKTIDTSCSYLLDKGLINTIETNLLLSNPKEANTILSLADYTKIIESDSSLKHDCIRALLKRAEIFRKKGEYSQAIKDCNQIVDMPDIESEILALSLLVRGSSYVHQGVYEEALADFSHVINLTDISNEFLAGALFGRAAIYGLQGMNEKALVDFSQIIDMPDVVTEFVIQSLNYRGRIYKQLGMIKNVIGDLTSIINMADESNEQLPEALVNRGAIYRKIRKHKEALSDLTRVINMTNPPPRLVIEALYNRGGVYGQEKNFEEALDDFSKITNSLKAPLDVTIKAFTASATVYMLQNKWKKADSLLEKGLSIENGKPENYYFLSIVDFYYKSILDTSLRQERVSSLLLLCSNNKQALSALGADLIKHLAVLAKSDSLKDNLTSWRDAWTNAMQDYEELEVASRIFSVGIDFLLADKDEPVLLDLVESEREILRQTFNIDE